MRNYMLIGIDPSPDREAGEQAVFVCVDGGPEADTYLMTYEEAKKLADIQRGSFSHIKYVIMSVGPVAG